METKKITLTYELDVVMEMSILLQEAKSELENIAQKIGGNNMEIFDEDVKNIIVELTNDYLVNYDNADMSKLECMRKYFEEHFSAIVKKYFKGE